MRYATLVLYIYISEKNECCETYKSLKLRHLHANSSSSDGSGQFAQRLTPPQKAARLLSLAHVRVYELWWTTHPNTPLAPVANMYIRVQHHRGKELEAFQEEAHIETEWATPRAHSCTTDKLIFAYIPRWGLGQPQLAHSSAAWRVVSFGVPSSIATAHWLCG